jgi:hypothetical protein
MYLWDVTRLCCMLAVPGIVILWIESYRACLIVSVATPNHALSVRSERASVSIASSWRTEPLNKCGFRLAAEPLAPLFPQRFDSNWQGIAGIGITGGGGVNEGIEDGRGDYGFSRVIVFPLWIPLCMAVIFATFPQLVALRRRLFPRHRHGFPVSSTAPNQLTEDIAAADP